MRLKRPDGINIIPFIDIMLVLLTIVLTVSTLIVPNTIQLELPQASQSTALSENVSHEILITHEGGLFYHNQSITMDELKSHLQMLPKDDPIVVKADKQSPFDAFIQVVDLLKMFHHSRVNILVRHD
ncbi:MAG: biopolymer transporter ExbD [Sulfurospirillaceae bacterium]|nr:biopolymer transporter ExbD [Sulfurospirillaceae bacterium]